MKKNNKEYIVVFFILLIITNIIFLPFLSGHMSTDSYSIFNNGYEKYTLSKSLIDGRIFIGIQTMIMEYLHIPIEVYTVISLEIALIISCIVIIVLAKTFLDIKNTEKLSSKILLYVAAYYTIFNVMYIENLYYIEASFMALSILLYILAAKALVNKRKMYLIKSFILLTLGIMSYQGTISIFFLTIVMLAICKEQSLKEIIKAIIKAVVIALLGILVNNLEIILIENIYQIHQERGFSSFTSIIENIMFIFANLKNIIIYTGGYLPLGSYIIFVLILEILIFIKIKKQNDIKNDFNNKKILIQQIAIILGGILFSCVVSIISTSALLSGRLRFSMGAIIGFMFIHLWVKTDFAENSKDVLNKILIVTLIIYGIVNSINYVWVMLDSKMVAEDDKREAIRIQEEVGKYEQENQIQITKIAVVVKLGQTEKAYYPNTFYKNFVTHSALKTEWSIVGCYNYYTGEKLEEYKPTDDEINEYLEKEQDYLCVGETLYITAYMY